MLPSTLISATSQRPSTKQRNMRCVVGLSAFEQNLFFPAGITAALEPLVAELHFAPGDETSPEKWSQVIADVDPDIILSAWSTNPLPESFGSNRSRPAYLCNLTGSVKALVKPCHFQSGLVVSDWGSSAAPSVAESALMLVLMALRRTGHWHHVMHHERGWTEPGNRGQFSLYHRQIGLHGFGRVAQAFVDLVRPFSPVIRTYCPEAPEAVLKSKNVTRVDSLESLFDTSEIIVELAALTPQTEGSITEDLLRRLPDPGVFVNVGRGKIVDEKALIKLAKEERLRIALDVYAQEPLPADSPLRGISSVILTPHQAGPTEDHMAGLGRHATDNIARFLRGEDPESSISLDMFEQMS